MLLDYAGAGSRLSLERALELDPRAWAWAPKIDGAYARVSTDRRGVIASVLARSGESHASADVSGLVGLAIGLPDAVLHGELEAHTEAGVRARAARGWAAVHLFDVSRVGGRGVGELALERRVELLHRWQAEVECYGEVPRADWWAVDDQGDAHDPGTGRYVRPVPRDLRRLPIVPLARGRGAAEQLWRAHVELGGGEGIVALRLGARLGAPGSKRKVKATDTLDARVVAVESRHVRLAWGGQVFSVSARGAAARGELAVGDVVEVIHDGWYEAGATPRFPRIVRRRRDLAV